MSTVLPYIPQAEWTFADVQARLVGIPANRIRTYPAPGTATEADLLDAEARGDRLCELIDGILVEKVMASLESALAMALAHCIQVYLDTRNLGMVLGEAGMLKISPGQVRIPDISFIRWERFPGGRPFDLPIFPLAPDLAIEIISKGNTADEMDRKLHDYFTAGVLLVWYIDPRTRDARAYTAADAWTAIGIDDSLLGGSVLPGFELPLRQLFARIEGPR